jgi:flagellar hook-associated protein 2
MDKITQFVDAYNTLIGDLQGKLDEEVHRAYDPLTDEERESLSDSQQEKWEEMAKSGMLRNDINVSSLLNTMRTAFYTDVDGVGKAPADIGLCTGAYYQKGMIIIDEDALRSALENNPDEVVSMFTKQSDAEDLTEKFNGSGLAARISDAFLQYTEQTTSVSIDSLERQIGDAEDRIDQLMDRMTQKEDALWKKFTAMETALSTMNSQSGWLQSLSAQE